ncbi:MAG: hypothetical protein ACE5HO_19155 [bacterium]
MSKLDKLRSRYLEDPIPVRLGGLAANLARVASFSKHDGHQQAVSATLQESKWFIEWTAGELDMRETAELVTLQLQLAIWQLQSEKKWQDRCWRSELVSQSQRWSQRLLHLSGVGVKEN